MNFNINLNPMGIPLASVRDSMQLDSGICLASLEVDSWKLYLEVRGNVRVIFNPDPDGPASPAAILSVMYDTYLTYKKDMEDRRKAITEAVSFFHRKMDELKGLVKVEEECGSYPHDTITTYTVEYAHEGEPTLFAELRTYMDRDGGEEDPDIRVWVNGFTTTDKDVEAIVNEVFGL